MSRALAVAVVIGLLPVGSAFSAMITATQTGGFYDGGITPDNVLSFQNYFVGYGTSPGGPRTLERRSFFIFDLSGFAPGEIVSAELTLRLPFGGLIFGKSGDPMTGPVPSPDDPFEEFKLGVTTVPTSMVTSTTLSAAEIDAIFESFNDIPVAPTKVFTTGSVPPPEPDGFGAKIVLPLDALGITALNLKAGSTIVLTGWMPSWTFDTRVDPGDPSKLYEGSELIFGLTDVHFPPPPGVPPPLLTLGLAEPEPVPEPASWLLATLGIVVAGATRRVIGGRDGKRRSLSTH